MSWIRIPMLWMFYLGGYAGTGKTFLLGDIINELDTERLHCLAPTGKAASVLRKKLNKVPVNTIHHALYKPNLPDVRQLELLKLELISKPGDKTILDAIDELKRKMMKEKLTFSQKEKLEIERGDLVIVDEASMVTKKMMFDLEATGAKCIFVGDPGQLPPVGDNGYFAHEKPDALLSEIQRQALDNPIIALSLKIRKGEDTNWIIDNDHIQKRPKDGFPIATLAKADQVLTGTNKMRRRINRGFRHMVKHIPTDLWYPQVGEKLICLKNRNAGSNQFINGVHCVAESECEAKDGDMVMDILYEDEVFCEQKVYPYPFEAHYKENAIEEPWSTRHHWVEFDYGYAITVHKSQGSEWDRVVVVDDGFGWKNDERKRWLYTAVTRAKEHLTWLTK